MIFFSDYIFCGRWSPNGDLLASVAADSCARLWDFNTEKVLYTGSTSDGSK